MGEETTSKNENRRERFVLWITSATSYSFPLLTTLPNAAWWMGIMIMPLGFYIYFILFGGPDYPIPFVYLFNPAMLPVNICVIVGLVLLLWSIIVLHRNKSSGLVTCGPYRYVRHPQYLAFIILTGIMTFLSVWYLRSSLGISPFTAEQTEILWLFMIITYIVIMFIEELYLKKQFGSEWTEYRDRVGFIIPFVHYKPTSFIQYTLAIAIPYGILQVLLFLTV